VRAAHLAGPTHIELIDAPVPRLPDDGILLAVRACGVCGSDLRRWREGPDPSGSVIPGHEFSGVVSEVGRLVTDYRVGEHLAVAPDVHCGTCFYCERGMTNLCDRLRLMGITPGYDGGLAEYAVLSGEVLRGGVVHRPPGTLSHPQAALAEPLSSVLASHAQAGTTLGDTVVVMGAGPIGCLHIAVAHLRGATVILSEPSRTRREMAAPFAPDLVLDPTTQEVVAEVRRATGGRGADTAICANPVAATHTQAVELVRKRGTVVLFGGLPKASPMTSLDANRIHYQEIRVIGSFSYHPSFHALALDVIARGLIDSQMVITHTFPLDEIDRAFEAVASGEALKVMVTVEAAVVSKEQP
jgi:L-iditol 2-dehydrogenase